MPTRQQLGDDAPQEVRIAVVPIRQQRVTEDGDPHREDRPSMVAAAPGEQ
jgi:hypothetical protein